MRIEERRSEFKKGLDATEGRRRRTETNIKLRKDKKEEGLAKRRAMMSNPAAASLTSLTSTTISALADATLAQEPFQSKKSYSPSDIPSLMAAIAQNHSQSGNNGTLLDAVRGFRKILCVESNPPVKEVLASGVLPFLIHLLGNENPKVQFEAAWTLTNIASTDHTRVVVDAGAVPLFVGLLSSPHEEVREQCAWCLGNIAGDSPELRNLVLEAGAMPRLLQNIVEPANDSLLSNCVWTLSNFCRGKPQAKLDYIALAVPVLASILRGTDEGSKMDALWALSYISDGDDEQIQAVVNAGIVGDLVKLLDEPYDARTLTPALRTVGNIVTGSDKQTQAVLNAGLIDRIGKLIHHPKRLIRKEVCWVLSNIAAGTPKQINMVMNNLSIMERVIELAGTAEWEVRKEATWVISNIATGGTDNLVESLVECGGIDAICSVLNANDAKIIGTALESLENILKVGKKNGRDYITLVDECDGLSMLEDLQQHKNEEIYNKSVEIIEEYFGIENDGEDEYLAPAINLNGDSFAFGVKDMDDSFETECPANGYMQPMPAFNFAS